jgi:hypothetical protein
MVCSYPAGFPDCPVFNRQGAKNAKKTFMKRKAIMLGELGVLAVNSIIQGSLNGC